MTEIITCKNLERKVSEVFTLGQVNLELNSGDSVALIGPNGAGKTTFFQLITGNSDATAGEVQFKGEKFRPEYYLLKRQMGYVSQDINLPMWVTPNELLSYSAELHDIKNPKDKIAEQIALWQIEPYKNRPIASCSHGMKKRAGLAVALLHDPELLILDEPFAGLDILHIKSLKETILNRKKAGKCTLVSTHILPYASELCNKAFTIKDGQVQEISSWASMEFKDQQTKIESHFQN
ncbi:ABC transporter ATP-binding protein [bacterium]|nr:ABC transporter ATP-binding protein [bacterium]